MSGMQSSSCMRYLTGLQLLVVHQIALARDDVRVGERLVDRQRVGFDPFAIKEARFWMTFGQQYLTYLDCIQNLGMSRIDEIEYEAPLADGSGKTAKVKIVPLHFHVTPRLNRWKKTLTF